LATVADLADMLWAGRPAAGVFAIGLTGGVASGKSTLAASLAEALQSARPRPRVERIATDGFLYANAELTRRGLLDRKGFPETYDRDALHAALTSVRRGPTSFPGYSHMVYDVDPALVRAIAPPDVLIVEGLGLDRAAPVDTLVYLDATEADQEAWYVSRFMQFWEIGRRDPASFYARFRDLDAEAVTRLAALVWTSINRPNLRDHIAPVRETADVVVSKRADHTIAAIVRGSRAAGGPAGSPRETPSG